MNNQDPRCKETLKRMSECRQKMIAMGIYMRPVNLRHTNVQQTWERAGWKPSFGDTVQLPASEEPSMCSTLALFNAKRAKGK